MVENRISVEILFWWRFSFLKIRDRNFRYIRYLINRYNIHVVQWLIKSIDSVQDYTYII